MLKVDLNGQWKMQEVGADAWLEVQVPGSVMNDLLQHGKIEDPFYRDNEKIGLEIAAKDFVYSRTFLVEQEFLSQEKNYAYLRRSRYTCRSFCKWGAY